MTYGQALALRLDEIRPLDDRRFEIRLRRPFAPSFSGLAKPWSYPCLVYPERFATVDPTTSLTGVVGSGPYRFVARKRVAGARTVYEKFETSAGPVSLTARPKLGWFERQEWTVITDMATSAAALQAGEVDWWEVVPPDFRPLLARSVHIVLDQPDANDTYACSRFNELHPPFDDPASGWPSMARRHGRRPRGVEPGPSDP